MVRTSTATSDDPDRRRWLVPAVLAAAVLIGVALWLTKPWLLFVDVVAEESLPVTIAASPDPADETDATTGVGTEEAPTSPITEPDETADAVAPTDLPSPSDDLTVTEEPTGAETAAPAGPVVLSRGEFISRDHGTTGIAQVVALEDGTRVLTIEDLDTDNGPDLFVYLDDDAADAPEGEFDDGRSLGRLRANQGDLVYDIPADVDLATVMSVGIWCDRFSSLFGAADLVPVG